MKWFGKKDYTESLPADRQWTGAILVGLLLLALVLSGVSWYWSQEPEIFWVQQEFEGKPVPRGFATVDTLIRVTETLLDKPGGYLSNDVTPPSIFLDNIPNWEFGVVVQVRDFARVLRNDFSRSQSQSREDTDLADAEPAFNFDHDSWIFPPTESKYRGGVESLYEYRERLVDGSGDAQFFARADNLREWLAVVEKRLGDLSQRLTASVGQRRVNIDLAGDPAAVSTGSEQLNIVVKTPWLEIDDVFYQSRGTAWALTHFMRAVEFDFRDILKDKNAQVSLRQVIRELEATQKTVMSPIILNGSGFGLFANHSLVMASYLSRANAAIIDLRELLGQG